MLCFWHVGLLCWRPGSECNIDKRSNTIFIYSINGLDTRRILKHVKKSVDRNAYELGKAWRVRSQMSDHPQDCLRRSELHVCIGQCTVQYVYSRDTITVLLSELCTVKMCTFPLFTGAGRGPVNNFFLIDVAEIWFWARLHFEQSSHTRFFCSLETV